MRTRFGDFIFDSDRRELLRGTTLVSLPPKVFQLLEILIVEHPKAVSQQELYDRLWPETFVEKTNLHHVIYQLREKLEDRQREIIKTVYGYGFSFGATIADNDSKPVAWQIVIGDVEHDLREGENIVGRERDAAVRIETSSLSRHHARILIAGDQVQLEDLGSKNGTFVQGRRVRGIVSLSNGDKILFGTIAAVLRAVPTAPSTETVL